jgi:hypothetical protein
MGEIDDTARRLLQEMGRQAEGKPSESEATEVVPRAVAENLNLDPQGPEYEAALNHLLALGDIERTSDPGAQAQATEGLYRLTKQGLLRAHEIRWRFMR